MAKVLDEGQTLARGIFKPSREPLSVQSEEMNKLLALIIVGLALPIQLLLAESFFVIEQSDKAILYEGKISHEGINALLAIMQEKNYKELYINSPGGSSEAGMKMGEYIMNNNIQVIAYNQCHSSCANYIFLPSKARHKVLNANIGMHGGEQSYALARNELLQKIPNQYRNIYSNTFQSSFPKIDLEKKLLASAGINHEIILHSANKTLFGEVTFNLKIINSKGEETVLIFKLPAQKNSDYDLWFPSEKNYVQWGIKILEKQKQDIPAAFLKLMTDDNNVGEGIKLLIE
jgi:Clp protease